MQGRPALEVADIFRAHGPAWREAERGHLSLAQVKVMSAIEQCRSAALGGHVLRCEACGVDQVSYNSCRNRHSPKCQSGAANGWLDARQADLLPVEYFHLVFTLPAPIADIAYSCPKPGSRDLGHQPWVKVQSAGWVKVRSARTPPASAAPCSGVSRVALPSLLASAT